MTRIQIQLTQNQVKTLHETATAQNKSVTESIRQSIDDLIQRSGWTDVAERRRRAIVAVGRFESGQTDSAEYHDDHLPW